MSTEFTLSKARSHLTDIANRVAYSGVRAVVTRKGRKLFAIVSIEDLENLEKMEDRIDLEDARAALADAKKNGTVLWKDAKKKFNL